MSNGGTDALSLTAMFQTIIEDQQDDSVIDGLPPTTAPLIRSPRPVNTPVADLSRLSKVWCLIGPGGAGKTVVARWLCGEIVDAGKTDRALLAALDPTNRSLTRFFEDVLQPPSSDSGETMIWLQSLLGFLTKRRGNAVIDFGGGDVSLAKLIERTPNIADQLEEDGVGLVAAYLLTPQIDHLTLLTTFETLGFRPRATALILNLARAKSPAAFNAVRGNSVYRAAIERGAVELWLPEMAQDVALRIERARAQFRSAMSATGAAGYRSVDLAGYERGQVRDWHERMRSEFQIVQGWLPWT